MKSKRLISGMLAATMALSCSAAVASADNFTQAPQSSQTVDNTGKVKFGKKFSYSINADGKTVTIVDISEKALTGNTIKIPSKIDGKKVTGIGSTASSIYQFYSKVKVIDIPKTVKDISPEFLPISWYYNGEKEIGVDRFTIACYKKSAAETYAAELGLKYTLKNDSKNYVKAVRIKKTVGAGRNYVKFKWGKSPNATGYRVFRYDLETSKWKKVADLKANVLSYKDTNCSTTDSNYYKVRAFRKSGGKTYWAKDSSIKRISTAYTSAPTIKSIDVESQYGETFVTLNIKGLKSGSSEAMVSVLDPYTKKWSTPMYCYISSEDYSWSYNGYTTECYGGTYYQRFDKGQTYKFKIYTVNNVGDAVVENVDDYGYHYFGDISSHNQYGKAATKSFKMK